VSPSSGDTGVTLTPPRWPTLCPSPCRCCRWPLPRWWWASSPKGASGRGGAAELDIWQRRPQVGGSATWRDGCSGGARRGRMWRSARRCGRRGMEARWLLLGPSGLDGFCGPCAGQRRSSSSCVLGELTGHLAV
jgi:hypothetical protein